MTRTQVLSAAVIAISLVCAHSAWAADADTTAKGDPAAGAAIYNQTCVACHGENGKGILPGMPDFTKANGVLSKPTDVLLQRIDHGFSDGKAPIAMPPKGGNSSLSQSDIRNVLAYMRSHFKK